MNRYFLGKLLTCIVLCFNHSLYSMTPERLAKIKEGARRMDKMRRQLGILPGLPQQVPQQPVAPIVIQQPIQQPQPQQLPEIKPQETFENLLQKISNAQKDLEQTQDPEKIEKLKNEVEIYVQQAEGMKRGDEQTENLNLAKTLFISAGEQKDKEIQEHELREKERLEQVQKEKEQLEQEQREKEIQRQEQQEEIEHLAPEITPEKRKIVKDLINRINKAPESLLQVKDKEDFVELIRLTALRATRLAQNDKELLEQIQKAVSKFINNDQELQALMYPSSESQKNRIIQKKFQKIDSDIKTLEERQPKNLAELEQEWNNITKKIENVHDDIMQEALTGQLDRKIQIPVIFVIEHTYIPQLKEFTKEVDFNKQRISLAKNMDATELEGIRKSLSQKFEKIKEMIDKDSWFVESIVNKNQALQQAFQMASDAGTSINSLIDKQLLLKPSQKQKQPQVQQQQEKKSEELNEIMADIKKLENLKTSYDFIIEGYQKPLLKKIEKLTNQKQQYDIRDNLYAPALRKAQEFCANTMPIREALTERKRVLLVKLTNLKNPNGYQALVKERDNLAQDIQTEIQKYSGLPQIEFEKLLKNLNDEFAKKGAPFTIKAKKTNLDEESLALTKQIETECIPEWITFTKEVNETTKIVQQLNMREKDSNIPLGKLYNDHSFDNKYELLTNKFNALKEKAEGLPIWEKYLKVKKEAYDRLDNFTRELKYQMEMYRINFRFGNLY
jgi:hypothetical protein